MGLGLAGAVFEKFCYDGGLLLPSVVILGCRLAVYSAVASCVTHFVRVGLAALVGINVIFGSFYGNRR